MIVGGSPGAAPYIWEPGPSPRFGAPPKHRENRRGAPRSNPPRAKLPQGVDQSVNRQSELNRSSEVAEVAERAAIVSRATSGIAAASVATTAAEVWQSRSLPGEEWFDAGAKGGGECLVPQRHTAAPVQQHRRGDETPLWQQAARCRQQARPAAGMADATTCRSEHWQPHEHENSGSASTGISTAANQTTDCARYARITIAYAFAAISATANSGLMPSITYCRVGRAQRAPTMRARRTLPGLSTGETTSAAEAGSSRSPRTSLRPACRPCGTGPSTA